MEIDNYSKVIKGDEMKETRPRSTPHRVCQTFVRSAFQKKRRMTTIAETTKPQYKQATWVNQTLHAE